MNPLPKVAVVILNWNGVEHLRRFLPSVVASTYPELEIILADNASTDDSVQWVQENFSQVTILQNKVNNGYAGGYNYFLPKIMADYYVLLNSDVEVAPNWIEPIIALMEADATIAACQPKIRSFLHKDYFEYAGAGGGWIDRLGYPFARGRVFDTLEKDEGQYEDNCPVFWASGAAFFVRSQCFHEAGGFNAYFFAHMEEIELCWRLQEFGYKIYVCPASVVYHLGGGTLSAGQPQKVYLNFRNNLIMLAQHWHWKQTIWKIPVRFALDALSAWKNLLTGNPGYWLAVAKAHFAFMYWMLQNYVSVLQKSRSSFSVEGVFKGSVVKAYFLERKTLFSQIVKRK